MTKLKRNFFSNPYKGQQAKYNPTKGNYNIFLYKFKKNVKFSKIDQIENPLPLKPNKAYNGNRIWIKFFL